MSGNITFNYDKVPDIDTYINPKTKRKIKTNGCLYKR